MSIFFGVLAIIGGAFGAMVCGWAGVGIVAFFAALAILFQVLKNNKMEEGARKGKAGFILGIIGVVISLLGQMAVMSFADSLKKDAEKLGDVPIVAAGAEGMKKWGFMGYVTGTMDAKPEGMTDDEFAEEVKRQFERATSSYNTN